MNLPNWLLGACGRNHVGMYTCSRCGYPLIRSEKSFIKSSTSNLTKLLPPSTIAAKGKNDTSSSFDKSMLEDFTKNFNLGRMLHKNSLVKTEVKEGPREGVEDGSTIYEIACGKCGNLLGEQLLYKGLSSLNIKFDSLDLTFRST